MTYEEALKAYVDAVNAICQYGWTKEREEAEIAAENALELAKANINN